MTSPFDWRNYELKPGVKIFLWVAGTVAVMGILWAVAGCTVHLHTYEPHSHYHGAAADKQIEGQNEIERLTEEALRVPTLVEE